MINFMNFTNFDFIFKSFLLKRKKICTLGLIVALNCSLLRHDICFQIFFLPSLRRISIQRMWGAQLTQFAGKWVFFQYPFEAKKMFCLPNKFVLFTNHEPPLKCVRQNSYLDLWSNRLLWLGVHLLVKLLARGTNK